MDIYKDIKDMTLSRITLFFIILFLSLPILADDFEKAKKAYDKRNFATSFGLFETLAKSGDVKAQSYLAKMYKYGKGVKKDDKQAEYWTQSAFEIYESLANKGDAKAQFDFGEAYYNGLGAKFSNKTKAAHWYQKSAQQGYADAQFRLGVMHSYGKAVAKDDKQAVFLLQKAAKQGHVRAQFNLGYMYEKGRGIIQDDKQAVYWYKQAVKQNDAEAKFYLGKMYEQGRGVALDDKKALNLIQQASKQGDYQAEAWLRKYSIKQCQKTAQTQLFETFIKCASRDQMMAAIKKGGARVKREDRNYWWDIYYTDTVLKGSSELMISYSPEYKAYFAIAQYTFPSHVDTMQVRKIKNMVTTKYGKPDFISGNINLGPVTYKWQQKDGIEIKVHRGWPDTTSYLTYTYPKNNELRVAEMEQQRKAQDKKESMFQSNAF